MSGELHFDVSLKKNQILFKIIGLNINERKKRNFRQNFLITFNLLWLLTDCICTLMQIVIGYRKGEEFTDLTYIGACVMYLFLAELRIFFLSLEEKTIDFLIASLRTLEVKANGFENERKDEVFETKLKKLNALTKWLSIFNCVLFFLFHVLPLIVISLNYLTTGKLELMLPILECYPFDSFDLRYWPFAYSHQVWSGIVTIIGMCATDYFFYTCCTHIRIQFKLLQHQFKEVIPHRNVAGMSSLDHTCIRIKFRELIIWHQEIIRAADMLKDIYSKSILWNFMCSSLVICLTGFNVTVSDKKIHFFTFLLISLMQVFILCLFGDVLMRSSMNVLHTVYDSKWYLSDVAMRRNILLVLIRAQKPCKLTAAGFADVHLRAYMKILSTSWSYFALLQTIYGSHS